MHLLAGISLLHLLDQLNNAVEFRLRSTSIIQKFFELILRQVRLHVGYHIKRLPPAIEYLKAGPAISTAESTVVKGNRPA
jgi:hypothetical protein